MSPPIPKQKAHEPIALVGSACRFAANASSPSKLWSLLRSPVDARVTIPNSRFNITGHYHANSAHHGRSNVAHAYLLADDNNSDPAAFDAEFFGINPVEARAMDPQQRMLLEIVYEAIDAAGMTIEGLRGSDTAVFAGVMCGDYEALLLRDLDAVPTYFATGTSRAVLSNRVSYFFDWHGASVTTDTACSSSLVAVHNAVQALRAGDSRMAVACGSNLILGPEMFVIESKLKMLSPDGRGRMWDKDANGYARGEGVAALVLKTLSTALADGDHIECIIRETGLNSDGATAGLTMPSASAQKALIQSTYAKAGLDLSVSHDRPQYFEAHGTGTPAGDPVEAEAISSAFFSHTSDNPDSVSSTHPTLFVGSIKTVLGHTEGTAGVAAILKASLALQKSIVPPNLLFENLSPAVAPFYEHLEILNAAQPWPKIAQGPRRASVNSFGFGGTNAHAILESYDYNEPHTTMEAGLFTPFVFSAASEETLRANLSAIHAHLESNPDLSLDNLAFTLRERRSMLAHRAALPATTSVAELRSQIEARLADAKVGVETLSRSSRSALLGVFTGQGAQYAQMGASLIQRSPLARQIIRTLETALAKLPSGDAPVWSLEAELLAGPATSRVSEAAISQPLCTAVQIMLVDLLATANVHFDAVVGHSSGEIAAAYAAGFITARDAICIAYYRGLHCKNAASPSGGNTKGAMLAAGVSFQDAAELCDEFEGRLNVAAVNSALSVTISGDEDAIEELELILEDENKFHHRLKVDQAYHSSHMLPCSSPYVESLRRAGVTATNPDSLPGLLKPKWFSSVRPEAHEVKHSPALSGAYWADNLISPVLFSNALASALSANMNSFATVLEVGAHPALKRPASATIQETLGIDQSIPYHGTLSREGDAVEAFSSCLGFLWAQGSHPSLNLSRCQVAMASADSTAATSSDANNGQGQFRVLKNLPTYQWKHTTKYWHESRRSRRMRLRQTPFHALLGDVSPESSPHTLRWKNILKPSEMPWLEGHQVQGQIVFPAAGYVSTAIEAARSLALGTGTGTMRLVELTDFIIHQGMGFPNSDAGVEVLVELSQVSQSLSSSKAEGFVMAHFTYSAALGGVNAVDFALCASGNLKVLLGETSPDLLPARQPLPPHLLPVEATRLYKFMAGLGYNFSGPFLSLVDLKRKFGVASCVAKRAVAAECPDAADLLIHPAELDAAIQSVSLAYSYPGDDQLRLLHMPTSIASIRFNPAVFESGGRGPDHTSLDIDSTCNRDDQRSQPGSGFSGNFNMYLNSGSSSYPSAALQVDQVWFRPVKSSSSDDRNVYYNMHYVPSEPDGILAAEGIPVTQSDTDLLWVLSRIVVFYLKHFDETVPEDSPARVESPHSHYLHYARHMTNLLKNGEYVYGRQEWLGDTIGDVMAEVEAKGISDNPVVKIMRLVGETMPLVFRGETTMLEHLRTSGLLDEYYAHGFGTMQSSMWLSNIMKQITDRRPHLRLLEIGAGTGGATRNILKAINGSFDSFTFTDISSSFFEAAAELLSPLADPDRLVFKTCDAEKDPVDQGFVPGSYDVVIAFLAVHATEKLDETMRNLRRLLRPGGFLLIGEGSSEGPMQAGASFIFGPLPGWWRGVDEGRVLSPFVNVAQWDAILKRTGFSGIDTMSPPKLLDTFGVILFVSQAVDEQVSILREPLSEMSRPMMENKKVVIVGGETPPVSKLAQTLEDTLSLCTAQVHLCTTLVAMQDTIGITEDPDLLIISLTELDQPIFKDMTPETWSVFKKVFVGHKTVLWLTSGRLGNEPWSNMTIGFGRSAVHEEQDLCLQFLDIPDVADIDARVIGETLVRLVLAAKLKDTQSLYTMEPEIVMDEAGRLLVPRLQANKGMNDRLNSISRPITHQVDVANSIVELGHDSNSFTVRQLSRFEIETSKEIISSSTPDTIELRITHTILSAIKNPAGYLYLALGVDSDGAHHLTLVPSLTSTIKVARVSAAPCSLKGLGLSDDEFIARTAAHLVAMTIVEPLVSGQRALVYNPSLLVAQAIVAQTVSKGVEVMFATDESNSDMVRAPKTWIKLAAYIGRSDVRKLLPLHGLACFAGFSSLDSEIEHTVISMLSAETRRETNKTIFSMHGAGLGLSSASTVLGQTLTRVVQYAISTCQTEKSNEKSETIHAACSLASLVGGENPKDPMTVVEWTASTCDSTYLPVRATRFDIKPLFKANATYWICGMSGALGTSMCDWMIDRGVRHLVLTSRRPIIDPAWIDNYRRQGVTVRLLNCDVTDEFALKAVHQAIVETLPPIAGVLNGAMVLRDVSVRNMSFEQVTDVVRPKVLGSVHLDRIFYTVDLDFFVLLSSINCVIGNVGQANYAAANMGMCGLAAHRRKRRLASTVINVGAVIGAGYITQSDRQLDATVAKMAMIHLSEDDFHQIFAEAIEAGHPDSPDGPEISTGLLDIGPDAANIPKWYSDPKFSRFIVHATSHSTNKTEQTQTVSIADRLLACQTEQEVLAVVKQAFAAQLRVILQMTASDEQLMSMRSGDLGLDSLVSVDIRTWFLKNFQVSIPVLKIMANDASMTGLAESAAEELPDELAPLVRGSSSSQESGEEVESDGAVSPSSSDTSAASHRSHDGAVDWDAECNMPLPAVKVAAADINVDSPSWPPKTVLLTGASGLLGHHLVNALAAQPSIHKVICIAVRRLSERLASGQLPSPSPRIVYYEGDLGLPHFGLSVQDETDIFNEVDAVIHNGSDTSHLKYYSAIRETNVESTRQLVGLCLRRMVPLHYVSSAGVALLAGLDAFPEVSARSSKTAELPPADGSHGYMCGKWVCEGLLERVNEAFGLRIRIQRPSTIIREGDDAIKAEAELDWVNALLHYSHMIKAAPKAEHNKGAFDLVHVNTVVQDIMRELFTDTGPALKYVNNVGDVVIPMDRFAEIGRQKGITKDLYAVLPVRDWAERAIAAGLHPAVAALIETFDEPGSNPYPRLLRERPT